MKKLTLMHKVGENDSKEIARWSCIKDELVKTIYVNVLEGIIIGSQKDWYRDATWAQPEIWTYRWQETYYFIIEEDK